MGEEGLEPSRLLGQRILSPPRIPIPPLALIVEVLLQFRVVLGLLLRGRIRILSVVLRTNPPLALIVEVLLQKVAKLSFYNLFEQS